ncbi:hypothetical protein ACFV85_22115 [Streptomyces niveus]
MPVSMMPLVRYEEGVPVTFQLRVIEGGAVLMEPVTADAVDCWT